MGAREGARALQQARLTAGLTQEQLAERAGVSERTIRTLESGRAVRPHRETLMGLGTALRLSDGDLDVFIAAWRQTSGILTDLFDDAGPRRSLHEIVAAQRGRLREFAWIIDLDVGPDRRPRRVRHKRLFEATGEIAEFLFAQADPAGGRQLDVPTTECVNCEPVGRRYFADAGVQAFVVSLGRTYTAGEQINIEYTVVYGPVDPATPTKDELLAAVPVPPAPVALSVRFDPTLWPRRVSWVHQPTFDGATAAGHDLVLSPFGVAHVTATPVSGGVCGIRWEWD